MAVSPHDGARPPGFAACCPRHGMRFTPQPRLFPGQRPPIAPLTAPGMTMSEEMSRWPLSPRNVRLRSGLGGAGDRVVVVGVLPEPVGEQRVVGQRAEPAGSERRHARWRGV